MTKTPRNPVADFNPADLYYYRATVRRIVDGDTLDLSIDMGLECDRNIRVRIYGANTPEVRGRHAVPEGKVASSFTKKTMEQNPKFYVKTFKLSRSDAEKKGYYGRYIAAIWLDRDVDGKLFPEPKTLSVYLVESGHAEEFPEKYRIKL